MFRHHRQGTYRFCQLKLRIFYCDILSLFYELILRIMYNYQSNTTNFIVLCVQCIHNYMFRPILGHLQIVSYSLMIEVFYRQIIPYKWWYLIHLYICLLWREYWVIIKYDLGAALLSSPCFCVSTGVGSFGWAVQSLRCYYGVQLNRSCRL